MGLFSLSLGDTSSLQPLLTPGPSPITIHCCRCCVTIDSSVAIMSRRKWTSPITSMAPGRILKHFYTRKVSHLVLSWVPWFAPRPSNSTLVLSLPSSVVLGALFKLYFISYNSHLTMFSVSVIVTPVLLPYFVSWMVIRDVGVVPPPCLLPAMKRLSWIITVNIFILTGFVHLAMISSHCLTSFPSKLRCNAWRA